MAYKEDVRNDAWLAPARPARMELRVRGSRFLADVKAVDHQDTAVAHLQSMRDTLPQATHHCWAFRVPQGDSVLDRCSDAGEPSGSAGRPLLQVLETAGMNGASLVVARWFGGTKLGIGPLARAYRDAAAAALQAAGVESRQHLSLFQVRFSHSASGEIRRALARLGAVVREESHDTAARLLVALSRERAPELHAALADASHGKVQIEARGTIVHRTTS